MLKDGGAGKVASNFAGHVLQPGPYVLEPHCYTGFWLHQGFFLKAFLHHGHNW